MHEIDARILEKIEDTLSYLECEIEECKKTIKNTPWYGVGTIIFNWQEITRYTIQKEKYTVLRELFEE